MIRIMKQLVNLTSSTLTPSTNNTTSQSNSEEDDAGVPNSQEQEGDITSENDDHDSTYSDAPPPSNPRSKKSKAAARRSPKVRTPSSTTSNRQPTPEKKTTQQKRRVSQRNKAPQSPAASTKAQAEEENDDESEDEAPPKKTTHVAKAATAASHRPIAQPRSKRAAKKGTAKPASPVPMVFGQLTSLPIAPRSARLSISGGKDARNEDAARYHPSSGNTPEAASPPTSSNNAQLQPPAADSKRSLRPVKSGLTEKGQFFKDIPDISSEWWEITKKELQEDLVGIDIEMEIVDEDDEEEEEEPPKRQRGKKRSSSERLDEDKQASRPGSSSSQALAEASAPEPSEPPTKKQDQKTGLYMSIGQVDFSKYAKDIKESTTDPLSDDIYFEAHKKSLKKENLGKTAEQETFTNRLRRLSDYLKDLESDNWLRLFEVRSLTGITKEEVESLSEKRAYAIKYIRDAVDKNERFKIREKYWKNWKDINRERRSEAEIEAELRAAQEQAEQYEAEVEDDYEFKEDVCTLKKQPQKNKTSKGKEPARSSKAKAAPKPTVKDAAADPERRTRTAKRKADDLAEPEPPQAPAKATKSLKASKARKTTKATNAPSRAPKPPSSKTKKQPSTTPAAPTRSTRSSARLHPEESASSAPMTRNKRQKTGA